MNGTDALPVKLVGSSGKVDMNAFMAGFRAELGAARWEEYRVMLTRFLMGKLSRPELVRCLHEQLGMTGRNLHNHNSLVLALLANACRGSPSQLGLGGSDFGGLRRANVRGLSDSREARLFQEVLSLPARERRRIKAISKEAPNPTKPPLVPPPPSSLLASRHAMLPHIPYLPDPKMRGAPKGINARIAGEKPGSFAHKGPGAAGTPPASATPPTSAASAKFPTGDLPEAVPPASVPPKDALLDPLLDLAPGRGSGPLTWTQDIIQSLDAPLIAETHEFPDDSAMGTRMLGVALENGLLHGIGAGTTDMMLLGVESYLRNIVDQLVELKHRRISSERPLTAEDLNLLVSSRPAEIGEHMAPMLRLRSHFLQDEPTAEPATDPARKRPSPWDLYAQKKRQKVPEDEEKERVVKEHEQGLALVSDLLG